MSKRPVQRPAMLVVTHLDVWELTPSAGVQRAGNQDMFNTLLGYVAAGYEIHVLTTSRNLPGLTKIAEHVHLHRVALPGHAVMQRLRASFGKSPAARDKTAGAPGAGEFLKRQSLRFWAAFQVAAVRHSLRLARTLRFELVYGYEIHGAWAAFLLARMWGVPCVTRFQGTELSRLLDRPGLLWRSFWTWMVAYRLRADLVVMANDGTEGDRLLRYLGQDFRRVGFWMNGIDKQCVLRPGLDVGGVRARASIPDGHTFILTTVRLVAWKRHDRALAALARVLPRTDRFVYVIVGDGPLRGSLERQAHEMGLDGRVRFMGALPHEDVVEYVNACDVYLSVNDLSNLGNPLIEATLCGRCIVTLDNGATRDLITHDVNGLMLPPDDTAALADALARLIENPGERARLAAGARERGRSLRTWVERMELEVATLRRLTQGTRLGGSDLKPGGEMVVRQS